MLYNQPVGALADASYVDGNLSAGLKGSIPPAAAIENPQREILNLIKNAGLTPSAIDLTQMFQAVNAMIALKAGNNVLSSSGYFTIPGRDANTGAAKNTIVQYGYTSNIPADGSLTVTFPITFPNAALAAFATLNRGSTTSTGNYSTYVNILNKSSMQIFNDVNDTAAFVALPAFYLVIGQ